MKKELNIENYCSKDKWRPNLQGVYHDRESGYKVATDTHILVALKNDIPVSLADKIMAVKKVRNKGIDFIEERYPKWQNVVHPLCNAKGYVVWFVDIPAMVPAIKDALNRQRGISKKKQKVIVLELPLPCGNWIYFAAKLTVSFVHFLEAYPGCKLFTNGDVRSAVYAESPGKDYCLMMPTLITCVDSDRLQIIRYPECELKTAA